MVPNHTRHEGNNQINATTKEAEQARSKISSAFSKIGKAAVGVGTAAVTAFVGLAESTREYRTEMGKLDTAFMTNGHSAEAAQQTYASLNAVLGDSGQAVEAANH